MHGASAQLWYHALRPTKRPGVNRNSPLLLYEHLTTPTKPMPPHLSWESL